MATQPESLSLTTGQRITWLRQVRNVSVGRLVEVARKDPSTIWAYCRDLRPIPSDVLAAFVVELRTSADFLLCLTDDPRPAYGGPDDGGPIRGMKENAWSLDTPSDQSSYDTPPPPPSAIRVSNAA